MQENTKEGQQTTGQGKTHTLLLFPLHNNNKPQLPREGAKPGETKEAAYRFANTKTFVHS